MVDITRNYFHTLDYVVMSLMLVGSAAVGIFFAFKKRGGAPTNPSQAGSSDEKNRGTFGSADLDEYLLGSRKMNVFPVAMSLVASYVSAVTVIGTPTDIYYYGSQYWMIICSVILMGVVVSYVYLPVFQKLRLNSSYQYLELRFNFILRSMASFMFVMDEVLFLPMVVFVPSITFNQVTGISAIAVSAVLVCVCVFYTLLGGIKAVVHTDVWQVIVMYVSVIVVIIIGTVSIGGPSVVFDIAAKGDRLVFADVNASMYKRYSFWSVIIGGFFYWTGFNSVNQTMVQRYLSLPTKGKAQGSVFIFTVGMAIFLSVCCYTGLLVYAFYENCDPMRAGLVDKTDQILPLYVMQTIGQYPGLPGLFIAGVFGAALSSLSVVLNSTALVIYEDIIKGTFKCKVSEKSSKWLVKGCIVVLGAISLGMVFVIEKLGNVLQVATTLTSISAACTFGMFSLGMLVPFSNNIGAIAGTICGYIISAWIAFGTSVASASGKLSSHTLPVSVEGCPANTTILPEVPEFDDSDVFPLYRLSYMWLTMIGFITVMVVGTLTSLVTGPRNLRTIDPDLISPVIHKCLPKEVFLAETRSKASLTRQNTLATLVPK